MSLVQEQRFQLIGEDGVAHLFIAGPGISLKPADLRAISRSQQAVCVRYDDARGLVSHIATAIEIADPFQETV